VIGGTSGAPVIANGASGSYSGNALDQICILGNQTGGSYPNNSCNTNQGSTSVAYSGGLITVTNQSLGIAFTLTPGTVSTPEPSSLLTLGSGLLGLLGFGFRRKSIV
jgi:hypothetical protein